MGFVFFRIYDFVDVNDIVVFFVKMLKLGMVRCVGWGCLCGDLRDV